MSTGPRRERLSTDADGLELQRLSSPESLSHRIAQQLEASIGQGSVAVGARLPTEARLSELFGVSRTAVREAIALLRSRGLVETQRGVGTRVLRRQAEAALPVRRIRATTVEEILWVLELRMRLEPRAAALAAERLTPADAGALRQAHADFVTACGRGSQVREEDYRFHRAVIAATHNPCFLAMYEPLHQGAIPRAKLLEGEMDLAAVSDYLGRIVQEHEAVLTAILSRDGAAASEAMERHFQRPYEMYASRAAAD